jgi:LysM repeat protein
MSSSVTGPKPNVTHPPAPKETQGAGQAMAPKPQVNTANSSRVGHSLQDTFTPSTAGRSSSQSGNPLPSLTGAGGVFQQQGGGNIVHTVREGDTLSSIAAQYGVSLQAVKDANPHLSHPYMIRPGDQINVPVAGGASGTGGSQGSGGTSGTGGGSGTGSTSGTGGTSGTSPSATAGSISGQSVVDAANEFLEANTDPYTERCLEFVTDVLAQAGISDPLLANKETAHDAMEAVRKAGKLNAWPDPPTDVPVGAVVFWDQPEPRGHTAIYAGMKDGKPVYITSPVGPMTEPGERSINSLTDGTPTPPAGYYLPAGMEQPVTVG